MSFLVLPPEVNSALMFAGAGSGPTLAAAAAWDGLAAELGQAANSFSSATAALADTAWQGPAATAMARRGSPLCQLAKHGSNTRAKRGRTGQGGRGGV